MIPFDVQLIGGMVLHSGRIAEMATAKAKTLVGHLPAYLNALTGRGVHVVTVNDYLGRPRQRMDGRGLPRFLNLTIGCIQHGQIPEIRRTQYNCDIVYGTNAEMGFDYLRWPTGMATTKAEQVQRGHPYASVDEGDSILLDEARTPLIIAGPATVSSHQYDKFKATIERIVQAQSLEANRWATEAKKLIDDGKIEEGGRLLFKIKNSTPTNKQLLKMIEEPELRRAMDDAELRLYQDPRKTELYALKEEAYFSIDPKTNEADLSERGRTFLNPDDPEMFVLPDLITRFHDIEADPNLPKEEKQRAKANEQASYDQASERIHNISQLLRAYCVYEKDVQYVVQDNKVVIVDEYTGRTMPGRRWSDGLHQAIEAKEGVQIDRETQTLATITIQNYFRLYQKLSGMTGTAETEANEFHDIYKLDVVVIPTNQPIARVDLDDIIYKTRREKYNAIVKEIKAAHAKGQPILVGTIAVESSELLSRMLKREGIVHNVLNAKFVQQEAEIVAGAGQPGAVTIATNMAGCGNGHQTHYCVNKIQGLWPYECETSGSGNRRPGNNHRRGGGRTFHQRSFGRRHRAPRIPAHRPPVAGPLRAAGRSGHLEILRVVRGRSHAQLRRFPPSQRSHDQTGHEGRRGVAASLAEQKRRIGAAPGRGTQLRLAQIHAAIRRRDEPTAHRHLLLAQRHPDHGDAAGGDFWRGAGGDRERDRSPIDRPRGESDRIHRVAQQHLPGRRGREGFRFQCRARSGDEGRAATVRFYDIKIKFEDPNASVLERYTLLGAIDRLWQVAYPMPMIWLRHSINLRTIGQKDPLVEYKREAYTMFSDLMGRIKLEIASSLFRTSASITAFESFLRNLPQKLIHETPVSAMSTPHAGQHAALPLETLGDAAANGEPAAAPAERQLPIRHEGPQLARNAMCPKGTGKKFK